MEDLAAFVELIRRVRAGEPTAAEELVAKYEPELRREIRMRLRSRDARLRRVLDSGDIVQSVLQSFFLRAAAGQYDLAAPEQLQGLLAAMARNKLAEQVRYQQSECRDIRRGDHDRGEGATVEAADSGPSPSREVSNRELIGEFRRRLSEEERQLVDLRTEGRSWDDVATNLGGTPEARRKQLSRAVDRIAVELGLAGEEPAAALRDRA